MEETRRIRSRSDLALLLLKWIRPLKEYYSEGKAFLQIGDTAAHYGEKSARMEGFTRVLWGVGPLLATENRDLPEDALAEIEQWGALYREGLTNGTNPLHEEYWGDVYDYDQKMVEMASVVTALLLAPQRLWEPLTDPQKKNLYQWLNQINSKQVHANNWRFFRILVNVFFSVQDMGADAQKLEEDLQIIENCYVEEGWYCDGHKGQMDYYIPFAMHFYSMIYVRFMSEADPDRCERMVKRAARFCQDYIYWFGEDGSSVPFGRSLTYRFAHSAFFGAYAYGAGEAAEAEYGLLKGMLLRNIEYWEKQPIFDRAGILTVGYTYPNLCMSERYNGPGSPYWGCKAFLALAFSGEHPFWQAEEQGLSCGEHKYLPQPRMLITHNEGHVQMYPVGHHSMEHGNCSAKYEKFVYSNRFGFSISRGNTPETGAFDSTLAVSPAGENFYRMRSGVDSYRIEEHYTESRYHIGNKVQVRSIIVPLGEWHVRIHEIDTLESIDVIEGGYAIPKERCHTLVSGADSGKYTEDMVEYTENGLFCNFPWGCSGILSVTNREPRLVQAFPNTNILHNLTVIPTLFIRLEAGRHCVAGAVYGGDLCESVVKTVPDIIFNTDGSYFVEINDKKLIIK